ncbi:MAG: gliding motility-associated ABC transporter permease subunit GldF [Flavobacteriaceae bacterium]|nr:gliding motility-associated ABC transporter permease subunit GldF [Flavobacteriaceae bacterium]
MKSILIKELNSFFSTPIGYLVIAVFLIFNGLFLWIFDGEHNVLNTGFADINGFFTLAPWIFIFLIPAITMRMFSDEFNTGTIEILKTKPLTIQSIIWAKFFASLILVVAAIIPTFIYVYTIGTLGRTPFNLDTGGLIGSYIGLLFLASTYTAIGLFSSTFSNNQIVAFIIAVCLSLFLYVGLETADSLFGNLAYEIQKLGMKNHYSSMARGVLDTRDLIYFLSLTLFFLGLTKIRLNRE